ncbi:hypothetical protein DL768_005935 [Monosporascus sp. mg162]|nr:hypothetical protein DL768_005935 [Monosporascus sp. mg162]
MNRITLYSHQYGPNPWKVVLILEELKVPYETKFIDFKHVKTEPYLSLNPNGRLPTIEDPNTGLMLWESGAIVEYLIERVTGVLDRALGDRDWLVGEKCTYADLSFVAWQRWGTRYAGDDLYEKFPKVGAWMKRVEARETVRKIYHDQDEAISKVERGE